MASGLITMSPIRSGLASSINKDSTNTILSLNIIGGEGFYAIFLCGQSSNDDAGSAYIIRYFSGNYYRTVIKEGTNATAPRIDSNGILKLNSAVNLYSVHWSIIDLG